MQSQRSRQYLFVAWELAILLLLVAAGLIWWNLPLLKLRRELHDLLRPRREALAMGTLLREAEATPAELEQIRQCYLHPGQVDLDAISWNMLSRPAPFVGNLPEPGIQAEGPFNRQQLRAAEDLPLPKPPDEYRVFLSGGSYAYSIGVPWTLSIASLLETALNESGAWPGLNVRVWNAAVPAWSSTHERIRIENYLSEWEPDLVIMLSGTNECHWAFEGYNILDQRIYEGMTYFQLINSGMRLAGLEPFPPEPPYHGPWEPLPADLVAQRLAKNVRLAAFALQPSGAELVYSMQPALSPLTKPLTPIEQQWYAEEQAKVDYFDHCFAAFEPALAALDPAELPNLRLVSMRQAYAATDTPLYVDLYHVADKGNTILVDQLAAQLTALRHSGRLD